MLRAVTFDFWNTLFTDVRGRERERRRAEILIEALRLDGSPTPPATVVEEALWSGSGFFDRVWYDEHRTPLCEEIVYSVLATLNRRLPPATHDRVVEQYQQMVLEFPPEPTEGAREMLDELAPRYRLALICDTGYSPGSILRQLMERYDMLAQFEYLYFSDEHGMSKPDVRVFQRTLGQLAVQPREAAHVGDIQRTDIAGAQAAGMAAVHFVGSNDHDVAYSTAEAVIHKMDELPAALDELLRPRLGLPRSLTRRLGRRNRT